MAINYNQNKALDAFKMPKAVYAAINNAATKTGVNFTYLVEKAAAESSFNPNAKAKTSSATGLFQFIDSTWMSMIKQHGDKYGLSAFADKIDNNGRVQNSNDRRQILNLRKDPNIASLMAAEFANGNKDYLEKHVGGNIGSTELYMAHFLGANGATNFLNAMKKSPNMTAADIFPKEARANQNVFYDSKTGTPRSLQQIYGMFDKKFDGTSIAQQPTSMLAAQNKPTSPSNKMFAAQTDPFARLAALVSSSSSYETALYASSFDDALSTDTQNDSKSWKNYSKNTYGGLSLTAAQMMLLEDFTA